MGAFYSYVNWWCCGCAFDTSPVNPGMPGVSHSNWGNQSSESNSATERRKNLPREAGRASSAQSSIDPKFEVFISHAGPDKATFGLPLHAELASRGISSFIDKKDLKPGDDAIQKMNSAMRTAPILVAITSPEYCARKYPMEELKCFIRRDEEAQRRALQQDVKPGEGGRPVIIPVFYRLSVGQCRHMKPLEDVRDDDVYNMKRFHDMLNRADPEVQEITRAMAILSKFTGIENVRGATNENTLEMKERREELVETVADAVERVVSSTRLLRETRSSVPCSLVKQAATAPVI